MEIILEMLRTDIFLMIMAVSIIILLLLYVLNCMKLGKIKRNYSDFLKKLGKGQDIEQDLRKYIEKVEEINKENEEIIEYYKNLDRNIEKCIQKVGMVRYSAFRDTGSDLSFALALLTRQNDGIVLNGIYSREMSNIYAKPIKNGKSTYTLSEEEKEAIQKAINGEDIIEVKE